MNDYIDNLEYINGVTENITGMNGFYIDYAKAILRNSEFHEYAVGYDIDYLSGFLQKLAKQGHEEAISLLEEINSDRLNGDFYY